MKEVDLLLGPFADASLSSMSTDELDSYEDLLAEGDQDIYAWASGASVTPGHHKKIIGLILSGRGTE